MWTGPGYVLLMLQHFCVYEAPSWLFHLEDMCSSIFHLLGLVLWTEELCVWLVFFVWFGPLFFVAPWPVVSTSRLLPLIFNWICFFLQNYFTLLYSSLFTFLVIKLPSVYYLLCDKVTYCTFHSWIPETIL